MDDSRWDVCSLIVALIRHTLREPMQNHQPTERRNPPTVRRRGLAHNQQINLASNRRSPHQNLLTPLIIRHLIDLALNHRVFQRILKLRVQMKNNIERSDHASSCPRFQARCQPNLNNRAHVLQIQQYLRPHPIHRWHQLQLIHPVLRQLQIHLILQQHHQIHPVQHCQQTPRLQI